MLKKQEMNNLIETMFEDKIKELTKEEQEIEIIKFREGLAPDRPSFIVNQENVVRKLKESFKSLYLKSLNMESWMLVSNYGNGKSHILNTIKSHLEPISENIIISIYAKAQNPFQPIQQILKSINREVIRREVSKYVKGIQGENQDKDIQIDNIMTTWSISKDLANLLWYMTNGDFEQNIKSLDILTQQDNSKQILQELNINSKLNIEDTVNNFFYILIDCLKQDGLYIIFLIEEFENVFKWKKREKIIFYEQLKELLNNGTKLGNIFFMLVATNIFNDEIEEKKNKSYEINDIDQAVYDRLKAKTLTLKSIQKSDEAIELIKKIKARYELFYNCKIDDTKVMKQLPSRLKDINYRSYIQSIALIMDDMVNGTLNENINSNITFEEQVQILGDNDKKIEIIQKELKNEINEVVSGDSSNAVKKKFISAITKLLEYNNYRIISVKVKPGYIVAKPKNKKNSRLFYVTYSSIINSSSIYKKIQTCMDISYEEKCDSNNIYFLYCKSSVSERFSKKINEYNPGIIKTIPFEDDDLVRILLLLDETNNIDNAKKRDIAIEFGKIMKLELEEKNE